jgi:hypothetical protein
VSAATLCASSYRHHEPSNQAVGTFDARDEYLGPCDSPLTGTMRSCPRTVKSNSARRTIRSRPPCSTDRPLDKPLTEPTRGSY